MLVVLGLLLAAPIGARADRAPTTTSTISPTAHAINDAPRAPGIEGALVVFDDEAAMRRAANELRARGAEALQEIPSSATLVVEDAAEVARLDASPVVDSIEPVQEYSIAAPPSSWGLDRIDQRHRPLDGATFPAGGGAGVTAYVLDSGIRSSHQQFTGRIPRAAYFDFGDGSGAEDCNGHGTHVAGTLGGRDLGVARSVTIVPVKAFSCTGSTDSAILLTAINWIIADHAAGVPAVANLSLSGPASPVIDAAVNAMIADGITVVVAAGNTNLTTLGEPSCNFSPGRVGDAITVAASTMTDTRATFSNSGPCNDLFAPGVDITSAWIGGDTATAVLSGTSMATPHVAGAAALELQARPTATPQQVWAAIDAAATPFAVTGCCNDPSKLLYIGELGTPPPCASVPGAAAWWRAEGSTTSESGSVLSGAGVYGPGRVGLGWQFGTTTPALSGAGVTITSALSIEAWIEPVRSWFTQVIAGRWTFASARDDNRSFALLLEPGPSLTFMVDDPSSRRPTEVRAAVDPTLLFDGVPHHVAVTWADAAATVYLDGVPIASAATAGGPVQAASNVAFTVGDARGPVRFAYVGMLDELTIYQRSLTATEIEAIVGAGRTGKCQPTVAD